MSFMRSQVKPAGTQRQAGGQSVSRNAAAVADAVLRRPWLALARRHWLACVLLTAGLVLRVLTQMAYRPALFYIDTTRYVYNAEGMDPVGYKGPLRAILFVGNFDVVAGFQHLLGLGLAVVIYLLLLRRGAPRWLSALAMAPVLLDAYQLQMEQTILPDTLFEALIVAGLAILLWRPGGGWRRIAAAGVVLGSSATVVQFGEVLVLPAVIYVLALGGGWRRALAQAAALCVAFVLPILVYCAGSYLISGAFYLSDQGVTSLYGRTAAAADCATLRLPADERGMCPTPAQQRQGPDWLEYNPASPVTPYYRKLPRAQTNTLITNFNRAVLTQQPLRVLRAYASGVVQMFALTRDGRQGDTPISRWQFQTSVTYYPPWSSEAVFKGEVARYGGGEPAVWRPVASFLRSYQLHGGYTPGPLLALFTVTGLAGSVVAARRRTDPRTRQLARAGLLFFATAVFLTLESGVAEFSWRYQLPALVTLVPAGMLGIAVIISSVRARSRPPTQPGGAQTS
jgi:hypothetical protein